MSLEDLKKIAEMTKAFNAAHKDEVQKDAYQHRYKNLLVSLLFCFVCVAGMVLGYWQKNRLGTASFYILMIVLGIITIVAFFMFINYIVIIVHKKQSIKS
jgi:quinol-cytochrome oxidoreductase complex cytochrome b subunit